MNKKTKKPGDGGPAVLRFKTRLLQTSKNGKGETTMLFNVPKAVSTALRGMTTIEGTVNGQAFRATLEPSTAGGHWVRVNDAMCRGANAGIGDAVSVAILGPERAPVMPNDLQLAIAKANEAKTLWKDLSTIGRRDYLRWIDGAKTPETRARRVRRTVEQLSEGKRRPCCVNVYEFMLARVKE